MACGCYQPHELPSGSPCSVAAPTCPEGQTCILVNSDFACETNPGPDKPDGQLPNDGPPPGTHRLTYSATVTACVGSTFPGETVCDDLYGLASLVVTSLDMTAMMPLEAYLRFDFDAALAGKTVALVTLEMTATNVAMAASDKSGSVWQANPFTQDSIDSATPGKTAMPVLAADRGSVAKGALVEWPLANSLIDATSPLCLEIESTSTNNVIYDRGAKLFIDVY
jgi:hypothetical protein